MMRASGKSSQIFTCFVIYSFISLSSAAQAEPIELFPAGAPGEVRDWPGPEAVVSPYGSKGVTNVSRPTIEPFLVSNNSGAAVVVAPGGGYKYLELEKEGSDIAARFNELGISAFVLKYRVPIRDDSGAHTRTNAPLQDIQRALGIIRSRAVQFGVNVSRLGVIGFSAGGDLSTRIAAQWQKRDYKHVDKADDESCRPDFTLLLYPGTNGSLAPSNPPLFAAQAADDPGAQHTLTYYSKALAAGVPSPTLHMYPKGGHGFGICKGRAFQECCEWPQHALRFLQDNEFVPGFPASAAII